MKKSKIEMLMAGYPPFSTRRWQELVVAEVSPAGRGVIRFELTPVDNPSQAGRRVNHDLPGVLAPGSPLAEFLHSVLGVTIRRSPDHTERSDSLAGDCGRRAFREHCAPKVRAFDKRFGGRDMASEHELIGPRWSVAEAAEKLGRHPSHLRRLWKRGVIPSPKRTASGRPYFDDALLNTSMAVMRSGVGLNGEDVLFYRRRTKNRRSNRMERSTERQPVPASDLYISKIRDALAQFGIPENRLEPTVIQALLTATFGAERPEIGTVLPELVKQLRP